jgi:hypothetical protein
MLIVMGKSNLASVAQQLVYGVDRAADRPLDRPHRHAFAQRVRMGTLGEGAVYL